MGCKCTLTLRPQPLGCSTSKDYTINKDTLAYPLGGSPAHIFHYMDITSYLVSSYEHPDLESCSFKFVDHVAQATVNSQYPVNEKYIHTRMPLSELSEHIPVTVLRKIASQHMLNKSMLWSTRAAMVSLFESHHCAKCNNFVSVFSVEASKPKKRSDASRVVDLANKKQVYHQKEKREKKEKQEKKKKQENKVRREKKVDIVVSSLDDLPNPKFPPPCETLGPNLEMKIIKDFCKAQAPSSIEEAGCAVCGQLELLRDLVPLKTIKNLLHVLEEPGVTREERKDASEKIHEYKGPVIDRACSMVCAKCRRSLRKNVAPHLALSRNLWIGPVPSELSDLNMVKKMLVAKVRHNNCFVRVNYGLPDGYGMAKMISHVIAFESPLPKIYAALPPPLEDISDVLAIMFTGLSSPCREDYKGRLAPLLVRRSRVVCALNWLILNHPDYEEVMVDYNNLSQYPEDEPPVSVIHKQADSKSDCGSEKCIQYAL